LVPLALFSKGPILSVMVLEIPAIGMVFVVVPIMIVLVITVIDAVVVLIVSMIFFLTSIVLRLRRSIHCGWRGKSSGKNKRTEKILISSMHIFILLAEEFHRGIRGRTEYAGIALAAMSHTEHFY